MKSVEYEKKELLHVQKLMMKNLIPTSQLLLRYLGRASVSSPLGSGFPTISPNKHTILTMIEITAFLGMGKTF